MKFKSLCLKFVAMALVVASIASLVACQSNEPGGNQPQTDIYTGTATQSATQITTPSQTGTLEIPTETTTVIVTDIPTGMFTDTATTPATNIPEGMPTDTATTPVTNIPTQIPVDTSTGFVTDIPTGIPTDTATGMVTDAPTAEIDTSTDVPTDVVIDTESDVTIDTNETDVTIDTDETGEATDATQDIETETVTETETETETELKVENPVHSMTPTVGLTFKKYGSSYFVNGVNDDFKGSVVVVPSTYTDGNGKEYPVTGIFAGAFTGNTKIKTVYLPDSITSISSSAFENATKLESIYFGKGLNKIERKAFEGCTNLKDVYTMGISSWLNITFRDEFANPLCEAENLYVINALGEYDEATEVVIPSNITTINNYAFYNYKKLASVKIGSNITKIGNSAFFDCEGLTDLVLSEGLETMGSRAFAGCTGLTKIVLPTTVKKLGEACFNRASGITSIDIYSAMEDISRFTFYFCNSLSQVWYHGTPEQWKLVKSDSTCYLSSEVKCIFCEYMDESGQVVVEKVDLPKKGETPNK